MHTFYTSAHKSKAMHITSPPRLLADKSNHPEVICPSPIYCSGAQITRQRPPPPALFAPFPPTRLSARATFTFRCSDFLPPIFPSSARSAHSRRRYPVCMWGALSEGGYLRGVLWRITGSSRLAVTGWSRLLLHCRLPTPRRCRWGCIYRRNFPPIRR